VPALVALALPAGPAFVNELRRAWDGGHAVLPVDPRLPRPAVERLLEALQPGLLVVDPGGRPERVRLNGGRPVENGDAVIVATSGSTGEAKGVILTHEAVAAAARASSTRIGVEAGDHWLACLPLAHIAGLSVVTRALLSGTRLTVHARFDPAAVARAAHEDGATLISLVPTALARVDSSAFRAVLLGGTAPLGDLPANVVTTYGLTETSGGVVYDGLPLDGVEIRVVNGEVQVRGPSLLRCYRDGHNPRTVEGWLPTGDGGEVQTDGRLSVRGRLSDLVVTGGENVWPAAVEAVLRSHPGVADVAVGGRPDPEWGERVVAWVVPADGAPPPALGPLRDAVKAELPAFAAPRELVIVRSLPRTALGKVRRHLLSAKGQALEQGGIGVDRAHG
jgi:o-succinylbenzoate---CoA ligase